MNDDMQVYKMKIDDIIDYINKPEQKKPNKKKTKRQRNKGKEKDEQDPFEAVEKAPNIDASDAHKEQAKQGGTDTSTTAPEEGGGDNNNTDGSKEKGKAKPEDQPSSQSEAAP